MPFMLSIFYRSSQYTISHLMLIEISFFPLVRTRVTFSTMMKRELLYVIFFDIISIVLRSTLQSSANFFWLTCLQVPLTHFPNLTEVPKLLEYSSPAERRTAGTCSYGGIKLQTLGPEHQIKTNFIYECSVHKEDYVERFIDGKFEQISLEDDLIIRLRSHQH